MRLIAITLGASVLVGSTLASANVPVSDAALLGKQSETSSVKVKLVPITTKRQDASRGVNCAVTTGKNAVVTDPSVQPQSGAGAKAIQSFSPESPVTSNADATGAALSHLTLFQSAGAIFGGGDANRSTTQRARSAFQTASRQAGTVETVMGALDSNSGVRLQNNLAWNEAITMANLWVTAVNALNLALNGDISRAASGMRSVSAVMMAKGSGCPPGTFASGRATELCRTPSTCETTGARATPDPGCVSPRYVDTFGNVLASLEQVQNAASAARR